MNSQNTLSTKLDVYQIVTDRIIELLEKGTVPWQQPWAAAGIPMNLLSKRPYRGINFWLLTSLNFDRNLFLTWDQVKKLGGSVKPGEHGHIVVFWKKKQSEITEERENKKDVPLLRYYKVFNISQCRDMPEGAVETSTTNDLDPILECDAIIASMPQAPIIKHKENEAFYHAEQDFINMPKMKSFKAKELYYSTLFHELVHSTGHEKRLNRPSIIEMAEFGSEKYSIEELIAELGASYLCSLSGILDTSIQNSSAYINGWLSKIKNDKRLIVQAAGRAQRAVDFIINQPASISGSKEEVQQSELHAD